MPDWIKIVRERLQPCSLSPKNREDVVTELAAHLEETCEQARSAGLTPSAALEQTLQEVDNWSVLAKKIQRAKTKENPVNHRTKTLWIPGLASLFGASLLMAVMQWIGIRPRLLWFGHMAMTLYWPWLCSLPVFGALGAYLSQRGGGETPTRLAAASFPALWLLLFSVLIMPLEMAHQGHLYAFGYFLAVTNWVVIPCLALLLGALPFLRKFPLVKAPHVTN